MIAMVKLDALFSSIEQLENPDLRGRPVCVVNGDHGSILITASHEAQAIGVQSGMTWTEAQERHPDCARIVSRPARYREISGRIMEALREITPEVEAFALDEAFLDLTSCQSYYRHQPAVIGRLIQNTVRKASAGLSCSVGISGDKTSARWAAGQQSPGGVALLHPDQAEEHLRRVPLTALCGIGPEVATFFAQYDVHCCGDMKKIPITVPARRYGDLGRRWWLMAQARDPAPVDTWGKHTASPSQGTVLPPQTHEATILQNHFMRVAEKLAMHLRRHGLLVPEFHIAMRCAEGWRQARLRPPHATNDGLEIFRLSKRFLRQYWFGDTVQQIRIQAVSPAPDGGQQPDFFAEVAETGTIRPPTGRYGSGPRYQGAG